MDDFEEIIKEFLDEQIEKDASFADVFEKEHPTCTKKKTVSGCCKYIESEVRKLNSNKRVCRIKDETVFEMAIHYFYNDEADFEGEDKPRMSTTSYQPPVPTPQPKKKEPKKNDDGIDLFASFFEEE